MKILFSPSESKSAEQTDTPLTSESLIFPCLFDKRLEVFSSYNDFLRHASVLEIQKLFGIKDEKSLTAMRSFILSNTSTCKAVERYDGVAYTSLSYQTLTPLAQSYIDEHVMIFSNLWGPLLAQDLIPYYKLKQGEGLHAFKPELFYKKHFTCAIDDWLKDAFVVDLRAGFYAKFYTLTQAHITMKFLKNDKVLSHLSKLQRGKVLRTISKNRPENESDFLKISFEGLSLMEIKRRGFKQEYVYNVID